jgi:UDP-N-acetyl-D-glucosamine dehydrogenase
MKISIIGQGYVGLPLAIAAANSNFEVEGLDVDLGRIQKINSGTCEVISDVEKISLQAVIKQQKYFCSNDFSKVSKSQIVVVCVPTPLDNQDLPDLSFLIAAIKQFGKYLQRDTLVIIESTVAPGTTTDVLLPLLLQESQLKTDELDLAYSPERIDPLNLTWNISNTPKLVSGATTKSLRRAVEFYSDFIDVVVPVQSVKVAETAKLLENSFRLVNISFINEIAVFCQKFGIEVNDVIQAASTKPYGFMPFYPGLGVGGHCIPVDPVYLSEKAKELDVPMRMIDAAQQINKKRPQYFVEQSIQKIGDLTDKRILVLGLAYKPNVSDTRETPTEPLIKGLREQGAIVAWHDDLVGEWNGEKSVDLGTNYDLAILATPHDYFDLSKLGNVPILNSRGSL